MLTACVLSGTCNTPPAVILVHSGIDFLLPQTLISARSVTNSVWCLRSPRLPGLFGPGTSTSRVWYRPMSLSCGLLCPSPFSKEWGSSLGYGWVDYMFGLKCISFLDGLEVFLGLQACLFTVRGFFLCVAQLWRLLGSLDSGLWFPCSFYP